MLKKFFSIALICFSLTTYGFYVEFFVEPPVYYADDSPYDYEYDTLARNIEELLYNIGRDDMQQFTTNFPSAYRYACLPLLVVMQSTPNH